MGWGFFFKASRSSSQLAAATFPEQESAVNLDDTSGLEIPKLETNFKKFPVYIFKGFSLAKLLSPF